MFGRLEFDLLLDAFSGTLFHFWTFQSQSLHVCLSETKSINTKTPLYNINFPFFSFSLIKQLSMYLNQGMQIHFIIPILTWFYYYWKISISDSCPV